MMAAFSAFTFTVISLIVLGSLLLVCGWFLLKQQSSANATNDDLLYTLTHDELANPLQSALATLNNLERRTRDTRCTTETQNLVEYDPTKAQDANNPTFADLHDLRASLLKLSGTTRNLRELAMLNLPERARLRERVNIVSIVQRMVVELGPATEQQSIRLVYEGADSAIYVLQNEHTLKRILGNILDNAIKYSTESENPCVVIGVGERKRYAEVMVSDNGAGMTPERLKSLGQAPQKPTAHNIGTQGSGIGLYLVHRLLEQNDGQISVDSEPGRGTVVSILLPLANNHGKPKISSQL